MIAAAVLGVVALVALYLAFGRGLFGSSSTSATVKTSPTPKAIVAPAANNDKFRLPTAEEQNFDEVTTEVVYRPGNSYAPDAGRNIFAFYEPPPPTPFSPTPFQTPVEKPPTPTPTPPIIITFINPQSVYAGSRGFRLEVNGERFTRDAHIYFSQSELPTTFINEQKLVSDIPANFISQEGPRQIIVQTPDGKLYSNQFMMTIQAPPRPGFQYIGMIGRKRYNNDTGYFIDQGKTTPYAARLNDVLKDQQGQPRFRLVDITPVEAVFEDTNLGFRHPIPISKATTGDAKGGQPSRTDPGFMPFNPGNTQPDCPPGIPCNIPRYVPPPPKKTPSKDDVDDDGDGNN